MTMILAAVILSQTKPVLLHVKRHKNHVYRAYKVRGKVVILRDAKLRGKK